MTIFYTAYINKKVVLMKYCPQCGIKTYENEKFCVSCGAELPQDIEERKKVKKEFNKWWLVPISTLIFFLLFSIGFHFYLSHINKLAVSAYEEGIELALNGDFDQSKEKFVQSLNYKENFKASIISLDFLELAEEIDQNLQSVDELVENESYQQAMRLIKETETKLSQYDGEIVNQLLNKIMDKRNEVLIEQIETQLTETTNIEDIKIQLWRVESIQSEKAKQLADQMKEQIVNYSYNQANDALQENQFSLALSIANDGLRYVPESERLESLKTTIEKQKVAFETEQQQRIKQALTQYEIEQENNENNAIELIQMDLIDSKNGITVLGELKSVATVPIYSVSIKYSIYNNEDELILENEAFLYPETLYPEETGKFEYFHNEIEYEADELNIHIEKISWYLEGQ